ncbi:MAG: FTR1 family protein [Rhodomicrobiaceae bacterium]
MYATAIIVFRETLEAALVISIVMAAARGIEGRGRWIFTGVLGGILGALIVAAFADAITSSLAGIGQELLNASILFLAVGMLGWHSVWMAAHARELAKHVSDAGRAVAAHEKPLYALAIVVGAAVLREGSETVLFLMGAAVGEGSSALAMLGAGLVGAAVAAAVGAGLYAGLLRIPLKYLFSVTNVMIVLLMAGMASQGVGFLIQADILPPLASPAWDTSFLLTESSLPGKVLHALIGYQARPAGSQVLIYLVTLASVLLLTRAVRSASNAPRREPHTTPHLGSRTS